MLQHTMLSGKDCHVYIELKVLLNNDQLFLNGMPSALLGAPNIYHQSSNRMLSDIILSTSQYLIGKFSKVIVDIFRGAGGQFFITMTDIAQHHSVQL